MLRSWRRGDGPAERSAAAEVLTGVSRQTAGIDNKPDSENYYDSINRQLAGFLSPRQPPPRASKSTRPGPWREKGGTFKRTVSRGSWKKKKNESFLAGNARMHATVLHLRAALS